MLKTLKPKASAEMSTLGKPSVQSPLRSLAKEKRIHFWKVTCEHRRPMMGDLIKVLAASAQNELIQIATLFFLGFLIEALTMAEESASAKNLAFNLSYTVVAVVLDVGFAVSGAILAAKLSRFILPLNFTLITIHPSKAFIPALAGGAIGLLVGDFFYYWFHRYQHYSKWLWAEHALHHSDETMNVTTARRNHWLEAPLEAILVTVPTAFIFKNATPGLAAYLLSRMALCFIHMNSRINLGKVFASPAHHRVHHSKLDEHIDKNFAAFFPVWDIVFGTYCPIPAQPPPTGLTTGEQVHSIPYALVMPFVYWSKMLRATPRASSKSVSLSPQT